MVPEAAGQHFQSGCNSLSLYGPTLSRQITDLICSCGNFIIKLAYVACTDQTIRVNE